MTLRFMESGAICVGILFVGYVASQASIIFQQCTVGIYRGFKASGQIPLFDFLNLTTVFLILGECHISLSTSRRIKNGNQAGYICLMAPLADGKSQL